MSSSSFQPPPPPRTPPPADEDLASEPDSSTPASGLGFHGWKTPSQSSITFDTSNASPRIDTDLRFMQTPGVSITAASPQLGDDEAPTFASTMEVLGEEDTTPTAADATRNPFGFQPSAYQPLKGSPGRSQMGQRRGHKYKHSSVSHHQIFLEPQPRAPLRLPASLPIPTSREGWGSMTREQTLRAGWCFVHLFVAGYVQWTAQGSLALTALSHLLFYDAIGAFLSSAVEVLSNFEVWKRSSIRQPFGLERSEVLVGFAMSILLLFMGFDLISHNAAHILSEHDHGQHEHRAHNHTQPLSTMGIDLAVLLAISVTLVSALMLRNHGRIARSMRFARLSFLPALLNNPSHLFTLSCCALIITMPLMTSEFQTWTDKVLSTLMACAMCFLGGLLVKNLGSMLLMSYNGDGVAEVLATIERDPAVSKIEEAKFWQVHYNLCMANLKLRARGNEEGLSALRERIQSLVRAKLGGHYGGDAQVWEVSTQLSLEMD